MERIFQRSFNPSHYHTTGHTGGEVHLGEENTITEAKAFPAVKTLRAGKVAACDEIRPEMLKALNQGVLWLTCVGQMAWYSGRAPKCWQIEMIFPIHYKGDRRECANYRGISLLRLPEKVYVKCLPFNDRKRQ